jgi:predicted membrane GTPase involved in stress response
LTQELNLIICAMVVQTKVFKILYRRGLEQVPRDEAFAGDIVSVAGYARTSCKPRFARFFIP